MENGIDHREGPREPARPDGKPRINWKREVIWWVCALAIVFVVVFVVHTFVFEPIRVDGQSMEQTLETGDLLFVTKYDALLHRLQRGDVIICHYPGRGTENFVKRLIAVGGDTVETRGGVTYIDGVAQSEPFVTYTSQMQYGPVTVPDGYAVVMGDNRADSHDSRYADVGMITESSIIGHVRFVIFPFSRFGSIDFNYAKS